MSHGGPSERGTALMHISPIRPAVVLSVMRFEFSLVAVVLEGRCRLHGGASGSGGPPGKRNGQYRHGERTKAAIAEQQKFSALLKMLRAGLT